MRIKLKLPTEIIVPRKTMVGKRFLVNFNNYRNTDSFFLGNVKVLYEYEVSKLLKEANPEGIEFQVCYILLIHHPKNENVDTANVLAIVEKFTCDALQHVKNKENKSVILEKRLLPDDSRRQIKGHFYFPGSIDKEDPHVEMSVFDNEKEFLKAVQSCYDERETPSLFNETI